MSTGTLYMIPVMLGDADPLELLSPQVKTIVDSLDEFIVENSKNARAFLKKMQIPTAQSDLKLHELNKHTDRSEASAFLDACRSGKSIGLLSDAGCPGVADPGADMVYLAHQHNIKVVPLIGPSSILLAMMASGMNGQSFAFNGYLPIDKAARKKAIRELEQRSQHLNQTQLFIETPYRNEQLFEELIRTCASQTIIGVACDLTLPTEYVKSLSPSQWKKHKKESLHKRPAIFMIHKNA